MSQRPGMDRREMLRKSAITGVAAAWTIPIVQTLSLTPAGASTVGPHLAGTATNDGVTVKFDCAFDPTSGKFNCVILP